MLKSSREDCALQAVTDEARRQGAPELSDHLEERLIEAISRPSVALERRANRSFRLGRLVPVAAVGAALAAAAFAFWPHPAELPSPSSILAEPPELDGDAVASDRVLAATDEPMEIRHDGRARWWLEPGGEALVVEASEVIRVKLLRGALRAEVVPSSRAERFVVEAGETRVAVHGTVFRVALDGRESLVDVDEGTVAVGPLRGGAKPVLLRAPSRERFGEDGQLARAVASSREVGRATPVRRIAPIPEPARAASPAPADVPRELTIGEVEAGVETVVQVITRCFQEHTTKDGDVRIRVRSAITLAIAPDGAITDIDFAPPLSPAVQACSERDARTARFAPSRDGAAVTRVIELSR